MPNGLIPTEESKRAELARLGFDPAKFDIDNETLAVKPRPEPPGILATIASNAAMSLPETAASLAGASLGAAQGARIHPVYGPIVGGIGGALAAPKVVGEDTIAGWKNKFPQSWRDTAAQGMEANPIAGMAGQQLAAMIGLKPSIASLKGSYQGIKGLLKGVGATAAQKAQLAGTGIGAGVGAAIPIGEDLVQRRNINIPRALVGAAGGSILNDPNYIGRKVFRLPVTPSLERPKTPGAQTRDVSVNAPTPETPAGPQFAPEVSSALEDLGYKFGSPVEMETFLAPVRDLLAKSPKARKTELTKLQNRINSLEASAELLPMEKRMEALAEIDKLRKQAEAYPVADLIGQALKEARVRGARIDYAPWETEGGLPGMGAEEGSGTLVGDEAKARDFYAARAEEAAQPTPTPTKPLENLNAEMLADALRQRQIEGPIETPRPKVTKYTRPESFGPDRELPQASDAPLSEAEQIQERYNQNPQMALLPGGKQYTYGPGDVDVPKRERFNLLASETHQLAKGPTPTHPYLASKFENLQNNKRALEGKYSKHMRDIDKLSHEQQLEMQRVLVESRRAGKPIPTQDPQVQAAIDQLRADMQQAAQDQIAAGQPVWEIDAKGNKVARQRGIDPTYFPMVVDEAVARVLAEGQGTAQFNQLRQDFIDYQVANNVPMTEAIARFEKRLGSFRNAAGGKDFSFDAVRTPEGTGLPDSWIERDLMKGLRKYWNKFAQDRAFWDTIETDPVAMEALGSPTYAANIPVPKTGVPNLAGDPNVKNFLRAYLGKDAPPNEPVLAGAARLTNAAILGGPITKGTDLATTPFKALAYTAPGHAADVAKGLAHWREGYNNAFQTGWNKPGGLTVVHDVLGFGEQVGNRMSQLAQVWTKVTGSEQLELFSRGLAQSIGEFIGDSWRSIAQTGDQRAIDFLNHLGPDWQTVSREELGTRIGMLMQGRYDATNLPSWIRNSPAAPFFTMMRWSVEQTNNFLRFAVRPALKDGNIRPLMMTLLGGLGGGLAINSLREGISGKKAYTPTLEELKEGYGKPGYADAVAYKMMAAAQITGTMGILSEFVKQGYELFTERQPQGFQYPIVNVTQDTAQRISAAVDAIKKGEPWEKVTTMALDDIAKRNVQAYRIMRSTLGRMGGADKPAEELAGANQRRDLDVWSRMDGRPITPSVATKPSYARISEKEFDRAPLSEAAQLIPTLVQRAITSGNGNPTLIAQNLQKLRTIDVPGMPSPERDLQGFSQYYNWVAKTQGPEAASRLQADYLRRLMEAKMKRQLIPQLNFQAPQMKLGE